MKKIITIILFSLSYTLDVVARDMPIPQVSPCDRITGWCPVSHPIDNYIPFMIFGALFLGSWMIKQKDNIQKVR